MNLDRLRYFCVIAETSSLRRAAEMLRLSPAALSKSLRVLEAEMGCPLVVAAGRGLALTDQGRVLATSVQGLLRELELVKKRVRENDHETRPLRLGSFDVFTTYCLSELIRRIGSTGAVVHELVAGHLERALVEREIDYGITYVPVPSAAVEHTEVAIIEMGIFVRKRAFAGLPLDQIPFAVPVTPLSGAPDRIRGRDGWPDEAIPRQVTYQVTLVESALELCRQGLAAAYLPRFLVKLHNDQVRTAYQLALLKPANRQSGKLLQFGQQPIYLARRRSEVEGRVFRELAKALRSICR
jgi:DNA-binding transcriptional LysR family regulator